MDVQIPHSIYAKVQETDNIRENKEGHTADNKRLVQMERDRNSRGKYDAGPCTSGAVNTAEVQRIANHGVPKRKKLANDIRQACQSKV